MDRFTFFVNDPPHSNKTFEVVKNELHRCVSKHTYSPKYVNFTQSVKSLKSQFYALRKIAPKSRFRMKITVLFNRNGSGLLSCQNLLELLLLFISGTFIFNDTISIPSLNGFALFDWRSKAFGKFM